MGIPSICVLYGGKDVAKSLGLSWAVAAPASIMWGLIVYSLIYGKSIASGVIADDTFGTIDKIGGGDYSFVYYSFMFAMTALVFPLMVMMIAGGGAAGPGIGAAWAAGGARARAFSLFSRTSTHTHTTHAHNANRLSIIIGGIGSGMKRNAFQLFMLGSLLLNYAPLAFWFWNTGVLANGDQCTKRTADTCVGAGWGWKYGIIDYSGGELPPPPAAAWGERAAARRLTPPLFPFPPPPPPFPQAWCCTATRARRC